jgi:hypothetical protein
MSRSSFFGFAATIALVWSPAYVPPDHLVEPRSRVRKTGALKAKKRSGTKSLE